MDLPPRFAGPGELCEALPNPHSVALQDQKILRINVRGASSYRTHQK
ncbi:unnamed protein product [Acanthoscelides obtectus]|uniref:Uncharacterized protein n=1 Tax=Acanthoscelides obtectus TaxID=200917 RepID=A0A9P0NZA8_ACAOB|nr:unnamed protein product [Acanthoscelides obtectus]CAK1663394.1 hypothetical protein AOBTE_LOCUS23647 [Acanthoscelides obtectus]